ncbi:MAG: cell division protein FtsA [Nitrospirota bacterium]
MKGENVIAGLDIGTTKVCVVVAEIVGNELQICGVSSSPSSGLMKGVVMNTELAVESIKNAVRDAESLTGININTVRVGISGGLIKGFDNRGAVGIKGRDVSFIDVERVTESAKAAYIPLDREVLHVIPAGYTLDGHNGIRNPLGMVGIRLEAKVYIVTGSATAVQNMLKCCEKARLDVQDIVFEPLASAAAILTNDEKELGVVIADIGGGTTNIILYKDGWLRHVSALSVGGNHFTNDIAVGLRVSVSEAERLKKIYGVATTHLVNESEEIEIVQAKKGRKILRRYLSEIIEPRSVELLRLIKNELASCSGYEMASAGIVLTGGGSTLEGFDRLAETVLRLPARIGYVKKIKGCGEMVNPMYASGVGLVLYDLETKADSALYPDDMGGVFTKMRNWMRGIFR